MRINRKTNKPLNNGIMIAVCALMILLLILTL